MLGIISLHLPNPYHRSATYCSINRRALRLSGKLCRTELMGTYVSHMNGIIDSVSRYMLHQPSASYRYICQIRSILFKVQQTYVCEREELSTKALEGD